MVIELHTNGVFFPIRCHSQVPNSDAAIIVTTGYNIIIFKVQYGMNWLRMRSVDLS
jgi:hypothetical protein